MKTIGLIGGMSWESSIEYYRIINQGIREKMGGLHSARSLMYSVDFAEIEVLQHQKRWQEATEMMKDAARSLEAGGADFVLICTNTMHLMAESVERAVSIPLLHIADATADAVRKSGMSTVGLLGTRFTMEEDFYSGRLSQKHGLEVFIPQEDERQRVHDIIYDELCCGTIKDPSRMEFVRIIEGLSARGAQGIILGCTEIGLLVKAGDSSLPIFDTMEIHARAAVDFALSDEDTQ